MWISLSGIGTFVAEIAFVMLLIGAGLWMLGTYAVPNREARGCLRVFGILLAAPILLGFIMAFVGTIGDLVPKGQTDLRVLRHDEVVDGVPLPKGTTIAFVSDWLPWSAEHLVQARLDNPYKVEGVTVVATVKFESQGDKHARMQEAMLAVDQKIDDIPCKGMERATFGSGEKKLASCILSRPMAWDGLECPAGSEIFIDPPKCGVH